MSDEDMQRTLTAEFSPVSWNTDRDGNVTTAYQGGYRNISSVGFALLYEELQIDLSGYALEKKTFFPYSSFEQRSGPVSGSFSDTAQGRAVFDVIIVSSIPLTEDAATLGSMLLNLPGFTYPGGSSYAINRDPLMHQHQLIYNHDSTTSGTTGSSIYRVVSSQNASSLEPTAADLLYCYRIVGSNATDGGVLLPAARVVLPGTITSEPKLEYMMRLKRSYELANQV